jgi:hypothetical protein
MINIAEISFNNTFYCRGNVVYYRSNDDDYKECSFSNTGLFEGCKYKEGDRDCGNTFYCNNTEAVIDAEITGLKKRLEELKE